MKAASRVVLWLAIATLLLCGFVIAAHAQPCPAKPTCDPVTERDRKHCGAELKGTTATGEWRAYWYPTEKTPSQWKWCPFQWATLEKYRLSPKGVVAIVDAIKDSPNTTQAIADAIALHSVKPQAGSLDEYEFRLLHYAACQALRANPPTTWTTQPSPCIAPVKPAEAPWVAVGGTIFLASTNGLTLAGVTTRKATAGQACSTGVAQIQVGAKTFYPLVGGAANERAECRRS